MMFFGVVGAVLVGILLVREVLILREVYSVRRRLDALDPTTLASERDKRVYVDLYRRYGWTPRIDPWTGERAR